MVSSVQPSVPGWVASEYNLIALNRMNLVLTEKPRPIIGPQMRDFVQLAARCYRSRKSFLPIFAKLLDRLFSGPADWDPQRYERG